MCGLGDFAGDHLLQCVDALPCGIEGVHKMHIGELLCRGNAGGKYELLNLSLSGSVEASAYCMQRDSDGKNVAAIEMLEEINQSENEAQGNFLFDSLRGGKTSPFRVLVRDEGRG